VILYWKRQEWLDRIDRRFFRDRFDAQRLLQDVIQRVKEAKSLGEVGAEVVTRIQTALHSEFVCILHHSVDETEFSMLACEPALHDTATSRRRKAHGVASRDGKATPVLWCSVAD
jgi:hypothetical protein